MLNSFKWSYYIRRMRKELEDLELGNYFLGMRVNEDGDGEIRKQDCGLFGTIEQYTLVKTFKIEEIDSYQEENV